MFGHTFFLMKVLNAVFLEMWTRSAACAFHSLQPLESSVLAGLGRFSFAMVFDLDDLDGLRSATVDAKGDEGSR